MSDDAVKGRPWAQQPGETSKAYAAFVAYLELGIKRSIVKALEATEGVASASKRRYWQHWSAKYRWVERASAYDTSQLEGQIKGRKVSVEKARQKLHDEVDAMLAELRGLSRGEMDPGQQQVVTGRDGKPMTTTTVVDGELVEVAVTKPVVPPKVRGDYLVKMIGYCGIVEPSRNLVSEEAEGIGDKIRNTIKSLDPEVLAALAKALNRGRPK
jgi:hypothetical protein